ncbi:hypothetical protein BDK51DRAFT_43288 [Blyttiomyces helicus]|uniref:Uncharacterized protein n=1 Tax=Blyttiomyces helicus TaxID=388810 RepID=A0A4P9WM31_9FUNG|nr:hypothetical protein BDK51DRAFT_43288 [Blyttiomyces helicus]|eukprot:RKO93964.1 hypothetical protein BDK51DRAFT_43288 [Blyttiomyces helicus]
MCLSSSYLGAARSQFTVVLSAAQALWDTLFGGLVFRLAAAYPALPDVNLFQGGVDQGSLCPSTLLWYLVTLFHVTNPSAASQRFSVLAHLYNCFITCASIMSSYTPTPMDEEHIKQVDKFHTILSSISSSRYSFKDDRKLISLAMQSVGEIAHPLSEVQSTKQPFIWTLSASATFHNLKAAPVRARFDPSKPIDRFNDASDCTVVSSIAQPGLTRAPLRLLLLAQNEAAQLNYPVHERELLAPVRILKTATSCKVSSSDAFNVPPSNDL